MLNFRPFVTCIVLIACYCGAAALTTQKRRGVQAGGAQKIARPDESLGDGVAALERGDRETARAVFEAALRRDSRDVEAHTYLGILADQSDDLKSAERHFAAAAGLAPRSPSARNNYGAVLLRTNRPREAAAQFEASLRLDPRQANALINLAQIRFAGGSAENLRAAEDLFRRADAVTPGDAAVARSLTVIALRLNDKARAAEYYRLYQSRVTAAPSAADATTARSSAELGGALLEAGLASEAEGELKAALASAPTDVDSIVRLARVYAARKDWQAAGRTLELAVANKVEAAPIYAALADVYEKSGHIENAIPAMRLAIGLDPKSEKYRFQYGILLANADAPAAAVIRLNEALEQFPRSARLWLGLGIANFKLNKNDEAARAFERAIEFDPRLAQAYAYQGMTLIALGQYDRGVEFYEQALRRDATLAIVHYLIADALLKKSEMDAARVESHLARAIAVDANHAPSRVALAKIMQRTERLAEAAEQLERAVAIDPNLAEAHYQLGRVYARLKRAPEAQTELAKFKTLSESQKKIDESERRDIVRRLTDVLF